MMMTTAGILMIVTTAGTLMMMTAGTLMMMTAGTLMMMTVSEQLWALMMMTAGRLMMMTAGTLLMMILAPFFMMMITVRVEHGVLMMILAGILMMIGSNSYSCYLIEATRTASIIFVFIITIFIIESSIRMQSNIIDHPERIRHRESAGRGQSLQNTGPLTYNHKPHARTGNLFHVMLH
jgi:hypothetical protein